MAHFSIRSLSSLVAVMIALGAVCGAGETFPVVHPIPILIRVFDGNSGYPLSYVHVKLSAGYDDRDLRLKLWTAEALTDGDGRLRMPLALNDFPLLRIAIAKRHMCQPNQNFSVEVMRRDGLATPNRCGTVVVSIAPGNFVVFARGEAVDLAIPATRPSTPTVPPPVAAPTNSPTSATVLRSRQFALDRGGPLQR